MNWPAVFLAVWTPLLIGLLVWAVCRAASTSDDAMDRELRRECERRQH